MTARTIPIPVVVLAAGVALAAAGAAPAQEAFTLQTFERRQLDAEFRCEGASFGDFDRDGHGDVVSGPFWYAGPDFAVRHEIFAPKTFDPLHYSDNFFAFPYDFDADGWLDVFFVGFPGQQATWYENPRGKSVPWLAHQVFDVVDNESPGFGDLTGDGRPELVCQTGGRFGWAEPDWNAPGAPWRFHAISTDLSLGNFTHGLGYGDVDGDGRADVLERNGWWQQPASLAGDPLWIHHPFPFSQRRGGAQMFAYDVDGDGDHDVITSLDAHGFGLSWFEQVRTAAEGITFREHRILDARPEDNRFGVSTSQLHALDLVDVDGDGLADIVTGKRYWAHGPSGDPGSDAPPELYWFALHRDGKGGAEFVPHLIDADSGVGVQVVAGDVDGDGAPDVVVGNKKGTFVFLQKRTVVDRERWQAAQPKPLPTAADTGPVQRFGDGVVPRNAAGEALNLGFESGSLQDWTATGTAFEGQPVRGDTVEARRGDMVSRHAGRFWIGGYELHGDEATGTLSSAPFKVSHPFGSFLVAGGSQASVRVELVRATDGVVLFKTSGPNHETMQRMVVDLQPFLQQEIFVRLVDEAEGGWGHLNFDDFLFHATRPAVDPVRGLPEIHPNQPLQENGFAPEAAARAMTVPEGFAVELIAGEPDLHQPIAFAIDSKGRLWVAEAFSYPTRRPEGQGLDKILVFEDADGDGSFETRTVFAEGLNLVSGLAVGFGGVWIGAAPQFLFFPDADDDLVPDGAPQVLLDGWGYQDTHETLNSFIWGPDGWLYGCHGVFTHSRVGPPGTKDSERTPMNAGVWRYHPVRHEFEVFAWGTSNPWGVDFDDHGQAMVTACVIPHLFHMVQGGRYHRQGGQHFNPYTYDDIKTVADHAHYAGGVGEHAWWGRNEPVAHAGTDLAGGGHAHCGAMIYLGDSFPPEYRDTLFMNNIHGNRMNRDILETEGSAVMGRHGPDFLRANDQWYRGVSIQYGPDGGVYFIDWYDRQACHRNEVEIWDRSNGRLYKVAYGDPAPVKVALDELDDLALVELQLHPNDWYVRHARRILQERGGSPAVHAALVRILRSDRPETVRLRALWALHCTGGLDEKRGLALLDDSGAYLQAWTVQLLLERGKVSARLLQRMVRLARETTSPVVRLYLASALQRMPLAQRWELAAVLVAHAEDAADHNLPYLIWYGTEALVEADPARALQLAQQAQIPLVARFLARRAAASTACHDALVQALRKPSDGPWVALLLEETSEALDKERNVAMPAGWPAAYAELVRSEVRVIRERAQAIAVAFGDASAFPALRRILADPDAGAEARERALEALLRGKDAATVPILQTMLVDKNMRASALRALASFDDPRTPARILAVYPELGAAERRTALHTLVSRPSFAKVLLRAVTAGSVARTDLDAVVLRQLRNHRDAELEGLVAEIWGVIRESSADKTAEVERLQKLLSAERLAAADLPRGRAVFARTCEQCHSLFGQGGNVGPDLTGSNRADLNYILTNVVDPNAVIAKEYQVTVATTHGERIFSGILVGETATTVSLKDQNGTVVVAKEDIAELDLSDVSMMPEDQLLEFQEDELRDLVAYLGSPVQVSIRATEANKERFFNGSDLAGWSGDPAIWSVENGEIVGRTPGAERNEFLHSELELGDFRLVLEVKLVGDEGNSGIQFRSRPVEGGEVAGYQADVGPGWWGKLYEERGRGLLWDQSGESALRPGEWNTYEILAVGHRIRTTLNGHPCVDLEDRDGAVRGITALQVHSGGATEVRFRNFALEIDPAARE